MSDEQIVFQHGPVTVMLGGTGPDRYVRVEFGDDRKTWRAFVEAYEAAHGKGTLSTLTGPLHPTWGDDKWAHLPLKIPGWLLGPAETAAWVAKVTGLPHEGASPGGAPRTPCIVGAFLRLRGCFADSDPYGQPVELYVRRDQIAVAMPDPMSTRWPASIETNAGTSIRVADPWADVERLITAIHVA